MNSQAAVIKETKACERYPKHRVTSKNTTHSESIVDIASLSQNFNCALVSAASVSFSPGCTAVMRGGALKDNPTTMGTKKSIWITEVRNLKYSFKKLAVSCKTMPKLFLLQLRCLEMMHSKKSWYRLWHA